MRDAGYGVIVGFQMEEKIEQAYLSLGEIADEEGISRQGVHDMVKRCTKTLEGYEEKLHLIAKFMSAKHSVEQIHALTKQFHESHDEAVIVEIEQISNQILEEL